MIIKYKKEKQIKFSRCLAHEQQYLVTQIK